jgi:hypothetical protein
MSPFPSSSAYCPSQTTGNRRRLTGLEPLLSSITLFGERCRAPFINLLEPHLPLYSTVLQEQSRAAVGLIVDKTPSPSPNPTPPLSTRCLGKCRLAPPCPTGRPHTPGAPPATTNTVCPSPSLNAAAPPALYHLVIKPSPR